MNEPQKANSVESGPSPTNYRGGRGRSAEIYISARRVWVMMDSACQARARTTARCAESEGATARRNAAASVEGLPSASRTNGTSASPGLAPGGYRSRLAITIWLAARPSSLALAARSRASCRARLLLAVVKTTPTVGDARAVL